MIVGNILCIFFLLLFWTIYLYLFALKNTFPGVLERRCGFCARSVEVD